MKKAKAKSRKVRRVVLGVGHPWFLHDTYGTRSMVWLCASDEYRIDSGVGLSYGNLGYWNKVRLVAEVLK